MISELDAMVKDMDERYATAHLPPSFPMAPTANVVCDRSGQTTCDFWVPSFGEFETSGGDFGTDFPQ